MNGEKGASEWPLSDFHRSSMNGVLGLSVLMNGRNREVLGEWTFQQILEWLHAEAWFSSERSEDRS